jgi:hypothetical protein
MALWHWAIANKYALLTCLIQFVSFLILDLSITNTIKYFKMLDWWLSSTLSIKWCFTPHGLSWISIHQINSCVYLQAKRFLVNISHQHWFGHFYYCLILQFGYPILLWSIRNCQLHFHAFIFTEFMKLIWNIFLASIPSQDFYKTTTLPFNKTFKLSKDIKNFKFLFHKINPSHATIIINKENEVPDLRMRRSLHRSTNVSMHQLQHLLSSPCYPFRKWLSMVLPKSTTFTNFIFFQW